MSKREEYTTCMVPWMKGGGEDRKLRFCTGAKICSGKAKTEEEARRICLTQPPSPPKERKSRGKGKVDVGALAGCILKTLDGSEINFSNLQPIISNCLGQKAESLTRERFIKKCFKENQITGDIKEAQKLRSFCTDKWKELEAPA